MTLYSKLTGCKSRWQYWSCSDFAHWVQKTVGMIPKPSSETSKGWKEWNKANKNSHPVWYWITEEGFGIAQDIIYFPYDVYMNFHYWFRSAYIVQTHKINTGLEKGQWYDVDTRMQAGIFNLVVEFVELEKANRNDHSRRYQKEPKLDDRRLAGLEYLDWEISLGDDSPQQALSAKETKEIYLWIRDVRPQRLDSSDISGWSDYCDNKDDIFADAEDEEEKKQVGCMLDKCHAIDKQYEDEDNEMLIRIINNRKSMWT